jgi:plasmid stabilization system protein ParE
VKLEWSADSLADLDRFERFLRDQHPQLAPIVAEAIIDAAQVLEEHPKLGRPIAGRDKYRQIVLRVLNATYIFQYRYVGARLVMLRVFHSRERRSSGRPWYVR